MYVMSFKEHQEYDYLKYKHIFEEKSLTEDEQKRFDELSKLFIKECEKRAYWNQIAKDEKHKKEIFNKIKPLCKFLKKFVKKCQSRQTGEKTVFYDIELEKFPSIIIYDSKIKQEIDKYNKIRGHSQLLSMYAVYKQDILEHTYINTYFIPAIEEAYEDYLHDNLYGKDDIFEGESVKNFQIDWFDEVYIANKKIHTAFQTSIKEIKDRWQKYPEWNYKEPESWERAWIDSVEYETRQR